MRLRRWDAHRSKLWNGSGVCAARRAAKASVVLQRPIVQAQSQEQVQSQEQAQSQEQKIAELQAKVSEVEEQYNKLHADTALIIKLYNVLEMKFDYARRWQQTLHNVVARCSSSHVHSLAL